MQRVTAVTRLAMRHRNNALRCLGAPVYGQLLSTSNMPGSKYRRPKLLHSTATPSKSKLKMDTGLNIDSPDERHRSTITNQLWGHRNSPTSTNAVKPRSVLEKTMGDSFTEAFLPFTSDSQLLDEYITFTGNIRVGKLFEDLDALAGTIAYRHCDDFDPETKHLTIVTASVDRTVLLDKLTPNRDYRMSGFVSHVGSSSMEVSVMIDTPVSMSFSDDEEPQEMKTIMLSNFTMVARDPDTKKAHPVNRLRLETKEEEEEFARAEERQKIRRQRKALSLDVVPPTVEESGIIHDLYKETKAVADEGQLPKNSVWMRSTQSTSIRMCHPQERNIHNSIFGGFLMKEAFELAWMTAFQLLGTHPFFLAVDDISFRLPVKIGSILRFSSRVTYSAGGDSHALVVSVVAEVNDPQQGRWDTTNVFNFIFTSPTPAPRVLPQTYKETLLLLDGRRRLESSREACAEVRPEFVQFYGPQRTSSE
eukprot:m.72305 g.72305  ORF g.72305 m.72305 type:complete len:477 (-) comp12328_c0_seq4:1856-3286(-)